MCLFNNKKAFFYVLNNKSYDTTSNFKTNTLVNDQDKIRMQPISLHVKMQFTVFLICAITNFYENNVFNMTFLEI